MSQKYWKKKTQSRGEKKIFENFSHWLNIYIYKNKTNMLDKLYDSYGYKANDKFVTITDQKNLKYPPVKRVPQELTEIESFISNAGQPMVDLVTPIIDNNVVDTEVEPAPESEISDAK